MDFWSADSLPIYGPQVRLLDVTESAPRCNHRKKRQDFRSHEGGFPVSTAHKKTLYCYEDDGAGWASHATSFCPDAQLVPSTVWRLKTDTSPALFVHRVGGVQDLQPQNSRKSGLRAGYALNTGKLLLHATLPGEEVILYTAVWLGLGLETLVKSRRAHNDLVQFKLYN
ncbi:hypothetical protein SeMB42_g00586 [Synchytrium endobioticum]|uniref:Uncharacterized protein n=1 Tax=Synchytrium endobioticum TaxID=286115 RepID=A0A507DRC4_9FUNG|nr:hypothetical protein SeMB42_g00586 [Synchytrium endobioticum]